MSGRKKEDDVAPATEGNNFGEREDDSLMSQSVEKALPAAVTQSLSKMDNNGPLSVLAYCLSSISMTVVNKYVVSGDSWNLTFLYLAAQVSQGNIEPRSLSGSF